MNFSRMHGNISIWILRIFCTCHFSFKMELVIYFDTDKIYRKVRCALFEQFREDKVAFQRA